MTDIKKTPKNSRPAKAKKLALNKETIKDLTATKSKIEDIRGGGRCCTRCQSGCMS